MTNIEFKRFTIPDVLKTINTSHLARFFDLFKDELAGVAVPAPAAPPGSDAYLHAWAAILNHPEKLPQLFIQALMVIENLAAIQNRGDLDAAVRQASIASPWLDPEDSPECLALQIWLLARYGDQDWMKENPRIECGQTSPGPAEPPPCDAEPTRPPESLRTQPLEIDEPTLLSSLEDQSTATDPVFSLPLTHEEAAPEILVPISQTINHLWRRPAAPTCRAEAPRRREHRGGRSQTKADLPRRTAAKAGQLPVKS